MLLEDINNTKQHLIVLFNKLSKVEFEEPLTSEQDELLSLLEQIIGGSMVEAIIEEPENISDYVNAVIDGDDDWSGEPIDPIDLKELLEILKNYKQ